MAAAGLEPASLMQTITMRYCLQSITHHALPLGDAALSWTLQRYDLLSVAAKSDDDKGIFFYFSFFSWKIKVYILHFPLYILCTPNKKEKIKKPRPTSGRGKTRKNALMLVDDFGRWLRNFLQGQRHDVVAPRGIRPHIRQPAPQKRRLRLQ